MPCSLSRIIFVVAVLLFSGRNAAADYRNPDFGGGAKPSRCDASALAAAQSYLATDPADLKRIDFRSPGGSRTINNCIVMATYAVDGKEYRHLDLMLGEYLDIDVIQPYDIELLIGEDYVYRPKKRLFGGASSDPSFDDPEVSKIFGATGCITLEKYTSRAMFFRDKVPCMRREMKEPFQGAVESCDGKAPVVTKFGFRPGTKTWNEMLTAADAAFQSAGLISDSGDIIDENGMIWGDPFATIALVPKDSGYQWAVLTTGYIKGQEPNIFTVVSPDGTAAPAAALVRDNYTCANLVSWVKDGVPESLRDKRYGDGAQRSVTARAVQSEKHKATPEDSNGDGMIDEREKLFSELLD